MAGGLMQLVAYGAQDVYLTGNPQITFFKVVYRRHTNFAIESIEQTFNGTPDFGKKVHCTISRNGDLVSNMTLKLDIEITDSGVSSHGAWSAFLGHRILNYVDIEIGGTRIDRQYGEWMHLWNQLTLPAGKEAGYNRMIGHKLGLVGEQDSTTGAGVVKAIDMDRLGKAAGTPLAFSLNIPLQFWFCRNPGLALPLIALQYHEVRVTVDFRAAKECFTDINSSNLVTAATFTPKKPTTGGIIDAKLFVDYIYLDTDERRRFAQLTHEYLIEQVQYTGAETITTDSNKIKLNFNHPIKELVWVVQKQANIDKCEYFNYTKNPTNNPLNPGGEQSVVMHDITAGAAVAGAAVNMCKTAKLQLNGGDRFSERTGDYFNMVQPYYHHTRIPYTGINSYSFALRPEEHQPSGTCNFSRLDSAVLMLGTDGVSSTSSDHNAEVRVYALNYNVLRVMSGMGGLAYSN